MKHFQGHRFFYVKNPFNDGPWSFAVYPDRESWEVKRNGLIKHVSNEEAFKDFKEPTTKQGFRFEVVADGNKMTYETDIEGNTDGRNFRDILKDLRAKYQQVTYTHHVLQ